MFEEFDFTLLDDPGFKEDSVRGELISPLLRRLGYSASPPNQITRRPRAVTSVRLHRVKTSQDQHRPRLLNQV